MGIFSRVREPYNLRKIFRNNQTNIVFEHQNSLELWLRANNYADLDDLAKNNYTVTKTGPGSLLQSKYSATAVNSIDLLEQTKYTTTGASGLGILSSGPMSVSFWIKADAADTSGGSVLAKEDAWEVYVTEPARSIGLRIYCGDRDGSNLYSTRAVTHANTSYIFAQATLQTEEWVYVTITKPLSYNTVIDAGTLNSANPENAIKIYFDGVQQTTTTGGNHANNYEYFVHNSNEFTVGYGAGKIASNGTPGTSATTYTKTFLNAQISDIALWSNMLTADEVKTLYQATSIGTYHLKSGFLSRPPRIQIREKDQHEYMPGNYGGYDHERFGNGNLFFDDTRTVERKTGTVSFPTCLELGDQLFDDIYEGAVTGSLRIAGDASGSFNTWSEFGYKAKSHGLESRSDADFTVYTPFVESKFYIDDQNPLMSEGTNSEIYPGLSQSLKQKVGIAIPMMSSRQTVQFGMPSARDNASQDHFRYSGGHALYYFNFNSHLFEPIGPPMVMRDQDGGSSLYHGHLDLQTDAKCFMYNVQHAAAAFSPPASTQFPHLSESIDGLKYELNMTPDLHYGIGRPMTNHQFPLSGRYHATSSQEIILSNYINAPFVLEKAVITMGRATCNHNQTYGPRTVPRGLNYEAGSATTGYPHGSNGTKSDIWDHMLSFFLLRQSNDDIFTINGPPSIDADTNNPAGGGFVPSSSIPGWYWLEADPHQAMKTQTYVDTTRELIGYGQFHRSGAEQWDVGTLAQLLPYANEQWLAASGSLVSDLAGAPPSNADRNRLILELLYLRANMIGRETVHITTSSATHSTDGFYENVVIPFSPKNASSIGALGISVLAGISGQADVIVTDAPPTVGTGSAGEANPPNDQIRQRFLASTYNGQSDPEKTGDARFFTLAGEIQPNDVGFERFFTGSNNTTTQGVALLPEGLPNVIIGRSQHAYRDNSAEIRSLVTKASGSMLSESPYVLYPEDKLVLGVEDGGMNAKRHNGGENLWTFEDMQITLYGSYLRAGEMQQPRLNQNLESPAVRESIGDTLIFDQWDINRAYSFKGTYVDEIISGSNNPKNLYKSYDGSNHSTGGSAANTVELGRRAYRSVSAGTAFAGGTLRRNVRFPDRTERVFDSITPEPVRMIETDVREGTSFAAASAASNILASGHGFRVGTWSAAGGGDPGWRVWPFMFPFESRYINGKVPRADEIRWTVDPFKAAASSGNFASTATTSGHHFLIASLNNMNQLGGAVDSRTVKDFVQKYHGREGGMHGTYQPHGWSTAAVRNAAFYSWPGQVLPPRSPLDQSAIPQTEEEIKTLLFGIGGGHRGLYVLRTMSTVNDAAWHSVGQLTYTHVRGWKYGIYNARPSYSSAVYRRDSYGQFRDMLEPRMYTAFRDEDSGNVEYPILNQFLSFNGDAIPRNDRYRTQCSNLSTHSTSSVPFFDRDNDNFMNIRGDGTPHQAGQVNRDVTQQGLVNVIATDTIPIPIASIDNPFRARKQR